MSQTTEELLRSRQLLRRLESFIEYQGASVAEVGREMGLSNGALSRKLSHEGNEAVNARHLQNLFVAYPDLNPTWLLTGEEEMRVYLKVRKSMDDLQLENMILEAKNQAYLDIFTHVKKRRVMKDE